MPKIAELREIDGGMWARIEIKNDDGEVTLWTGAEKNRALVLERAAALEEAAAEADRLGEPQLRDSIRAMIVQAGEVHG